MNQLEPPKNLTRNVLIGMFAGVLIGACLFYFQNSIPTSIFLTTEKYLFNLGGQIFKNLLLLIVVPLVFFSLVSGISSLSNMVKLGSIATKTISLYLLTTAFAAILAIFFGWVFNISGYEGEVSSFNPPSGDASLYDTVIKIFPNNIFGAFVENNMLGIVFISVLFGIALNLTDDLTENLSRNFERLNIVFLKIVLIILFIGCLFDWEYGYFQLVRFLGMVGFGLLAYHDFEKNKTWFIIWLASAILINPIFKIALGRELWNIIDIVWALLLSFSIFLKGNPNETSQNKT